MGRLGVWWENADQLIREVLLNDYLELSGLLTHFAQPSDLEFTELQRKRFKIACSSIPENLRPELMIHADNSFRF